MKIAYLDCFSGISGDMFLAALVDAGVPFAVLQEAVNSMGLDAKLDSHRVDRSGISSLKVDVLTRDGHKAESVPAATARREDQNGHHHHDAPNSAGHGHSHGRSLSAIEGIIGNSSIAPKAKSIALRAFRLLGEAEAKIHAVPVERIHFHEVGAVDAIADIVAGAAGAAWLEVDRWLCSSLNVGSGQVQCAHGTFPVPAPATLELLHGFPIYSSSMKKELVTPTGAALLRALDATPSQLPQMLLTATGYGAGSADNPAAPNVLRVIIGEPFQMEPAAVTGAKRSPNKVGVIQTTIDDATPELLSHAADVLLAAGASDVYRTPIQMKKGRLGTELTILCSTDRAEALQAMVFRETSTLGLRYREEDKHTLSRKFLSVTTEWGEVQIKVGILPDGEVLNCAPEYEDCRRIAAQNNIPLKRVMQAAIHAFLEVGLRV